MPKLSKSVLSGLIAGLACTLAGALAAQPLAGSTWRPAERAAPPATRADKTLLQFEPDGTVGGHGGCNSFRGRFVTNGDAILFGPTAATLMLCPEDISAAERQFFQALGAARFFALDGDVLVLSDADSTVVMTLIRQGSDEAK